MINLFWDWSWFRHFVIFAWLHSTFMALLKYLSKRHYSSVWGTNWNGSIQFDCMIIQILLCSFLTCNSNNSLIKVWYLIFNIQTHIHRLILHSQDRYGLYFAWRLFFIKKKEKPARSKAYGWIENHYAFRDYTLELPSSYIFSIYIIF